MATNRESPETSGEPIDFRTGIVETLKLEKDEVFRQEVGQIDVEQIPACKKLFDNKPEKKEHTLMALGLLETDGLEENDRFVARAAMLFHDTNHLDAAQELVVWQAHGEITGREAVRIFKHIWWHDFVGKVIEGKNECGNDYFRLFPTEADRQIHLRVYWADFRAHPELSYDLLKAQTGIKHFQETPIPKERLLYPHSDYENPEVLVEGTRLPRTDEVFVHDIRESLNAGTVLASMIANGANLVSGALVLDSEIWRQEIGAATNMGEIGHALNTKVATENGYEPYSRLSKISFLILGKTLRAARGNHVEPIYGDQAEDVAGIINQYGVEDNPIGASFDPDSYIISLNLESGGHLLPLVRLMMNHAAGGGENRFTENLILYNNQEQRVELVKLLAAGKINVPAWNEARVGEYFERYLATYGDEPMAEVKGKPVKISSLHKIEPEEGEDRVIEGIINKDGFEKLDEELEFMETYYPGEVKKYREITNQRRALFEKQFSELAGKIKESPEGIYDEERGLFYADTNCGIMVYPADTDPRATMEQFSFDENSKSWRLKQRGKEFTVYNNFT